MTTTLNPADVATGWVLSGGNLTATHAAGAADNFGRVLLSATTGKYYAEVHKDTNSSADGTLIGFVQAGASVNSFLGLSGVAVMEQGSVYVGSGTPALAAYASSGLNYIQMAIDLGAQLFWGRINNGNWNNSGTANPASGTGGISFSSLWSVGTAVYLAIGTAGSSVAISAKIASTSWNGTAPSGFTEINPGVYAVASQTLLAPSQTATATTAISAAGSQTLLAPTQVATGTTIGGGAGTVNASAIQILRLPSQNANGTAGRAANAVGVPSTVTAAVPGTAGSLFGTMLGSASSVIPPVAGVSFFPVAPTIPFNALLDASGNVLLDANGAYLYAA